MWENDIRKGTEMKRLEGKQQKNAFYASDAWKHNHPNPWWQHNETLTIEISGKID